MKKKILVRAPVLTRSGYGEHSRFVLRSLREQEDKFDIHVLPVNWGRCGWIYEDDEERRWLDQLITKTAHYQQQGNPQYDISIQVTIPNEWERIAPINIGVTDGIETNRVAPVWLERANTMDAIVTVSNHSKDVFLNTVYEAVQKETGKASQLRFNPNVPINVVHYPVKKYEPMNLGLKLSTDFNFLTVAQWGPRKNIENTIRWFVEEFIDRPVGLVVKTFGSGNSIIDRYEATKQLTLFLEKYENRKCKVYLLHGDLTDQEMHALYKHSKIKALISLSHGEGFGLPHFEAAYSGVPVIAPEWSGYVDFLCMPKEGKKEKVKPHFACIDYDMQPIHKEAVWPGVLEENSMWCCPKQGSYKMKLREVYKDYGRFKKQARQLQKWIHENFKAEDQYKKMRNCIINEDQLDVEEWLNSFQIKEYA